jgi:hypothetical protein
MRTPTEDEINPFDGKPKTAPIRIRRVDLVGNYFSSQKRKAEKGTVRVRLNRDYSGCPDGIHPASFKAGEEADLPVVVAQTLLEDGRASLPRAAHPEDELNGESGAKAGRD